MTTFKVRVVDGAVLGTTTAKALPASAQGVVLREGDLAVTPATHWWNGSAFEARTKRPATSVTVDPDKSTTIALPADAYTSVSGDAPAKGSRSIQLGAGQDATLVFTGKYAGAVIVLSRSLAQVKADLLLQIDTAAGEARRKWLTMVPGQADAYREKMVDVASLNTLGGTTAMILAALGALSAAQQKARWPFLYAEMQARGLTTLVQARDAIQAAADASRSARGEIEKIRRAGKIAVNAAASVTAAKTAAEAATFPA